MGDGMKIFSWWKKVPERKVILFCDDEVKIVAAIPSQSGWLATYYPLDDKWKVLCGDGTLYPESYVKRWARYSGWDGTETFPDRESLTGKPKTQTSGEADS